MPHYHRTISTKWPLAALFHYVCDIDNHMLWQEAVVDSHWIGARYRSGSFYDELRIHPNGLEVLRKQVLERVPYARYVVCWKQSQGEATLEFRFAPRPEGASVEIVLSLLHLSEGEERTMVQVLDRDLRSLAEELNEEDENNSTTSELLTEGCQSHALGLSKKE